MTYPKETRPPNRLSPLSLIYPCHVALGSTLRFQMTLFTYRANGKVPTKNAILQARLNSPISNQLWLTKITYLPALSPGNWKIPYYWHPWMMSFPCMGWLYPYAFSNLRISVGWIFMRVQCHGFFYGRANDPWLIHIAFLVRNFSALLGIFPFVGETSVWIFITCSAAIIFGLITSMSSGWYYEIPIANYKTII